MRNNSFDFIRLFAAFEVLYFHVYKHLDLNYYLYNSWHLTTKVMAAFPGVPVFYAISGYLVTQSFQRSSLSRYATNRARRIYPGLFVNILFLEILVILVGQHVFWPKSSWLAFIGYEAVLLLTASDQLAAAIMPVVAAPADHVLARYPSGVLWTLTVELSFYVAVPAILIWSRRRAMQAALVAILTTASLALTFLFIDRIVAEAPRVYRWLELTFVPYLWIFGVGMLMALLRVPERLSRFQTRWVLAALFVAILCLGDAQTPYWKVRVDAISVARVLCVGVFVVLLGTTRLFGFWNRLEIDISYGLYLWHMLVVTLLGTPLAIWGGYAWRGNILALPAAVAGSLVLALASWFLVEKPFLRRDRRPKRLDADRPPHEGEVRIDGGSSILRAARDMEAGRRHGTGYDGLDYRRAGSAGRS
jgi:peptidoglycan/LPS O-acetylase OafA/YrhL